MSPYTGYDHDNSPALSMGGVPLRTARERRRGCAAEDEGHYHEYHAVPRKKCAQEACEDACPFIGRMIPLDAAEPIPGSKYLRAYCRICWEPVRVSALRDGCCITYCDNCDPTSDISTRAQRRESNVRGRESGRIKHDLDDMD